MTFLFDKMELRTYQKECLAAIEAAGNGRHLCQLSTGLGKTTIFSHIPIRQRTLVLSHRQELVYQPLKYFTCPTSVEMGCDKATDTPVVSASVQTMARRFDSYPSDYFDTIIIDECHHSTSSTYTKIIDYFQPERIIGFTATPNRADGIGLENVFDDIIYKKDLKWGIENKYLSPIWCRRVDIGYDLSKVAVRMGDYAPSDLERALNVDKCNDAIAEIVANIAEKPVLIFAVDVAHAESIAKKIPGAKALSAKSKDRTESVEAFKRGEIPVLVNCSLFTEGTDLPNTRTVIIARPTKSNALYTQMVGRGTRLAEGKEHCLLIDCVGVSNQPLCTAPTLLGLDIDSVPRKYRNDIEGDLLNDIPSVIEQKSDTPESWINNMRIVDLWANSNGYVLHDINFQKRPDGSLFLNLPVGDSKKNASINITAPDLTGKVVLSTSGGFSNEFPAQDAYDCAFDLLRTRFLDKLPLWSLTSVKRWGRKPASEKQIEYIKKLSRSRKVDVSGVLDGLTKMQATSLIERLKN